MYYSHFTYRVCLNLNVKLRRQKVKGKVEDVRAGWIIMHNTGSLSTCWATISFTWEICPTEWIYLILGKSTKPSSKNSMEETSWKVHAHVSTMLRSTLNKQKVCGMDSSGFGQKTNPSLAGKVDELSGSTQWEICSNVTANAVAIYSTW
jgi:hypothetical protein